MIAINIYFHLKQNALGHRKLVVARWLVKAWVKTFRCSLNRGAASPTNRSQRLNWWNEDESGLSADTCKSQTIKMSSFNCAGWEMRFKDDGEFCVDVHKMAVLAKLKKLFQHSSGEFLTQTTTRTDSSTLHHRIRMWQHVTEISQKRFFLFQHFQAEARLSTM